MKVAKVPEGARWSAGKAVWVRSVVFWVLRLASLLVWFGLVYLEPPCPVAGRGGALEVLRDRWDH